LKNLPLGLDKDGSLQRIEKDSSGRAKKGPAKKYWKKSGKTSWPRRRNKPLSVKIQNHKEGICRSQSLGERGGKFGRGEKLGKKSKGGLSLKTTRVPCKTPKRRPRYA